MLVVFRMCSGPGGSNRNASTSKNLFRMFLRLWARVGVAQGSLIAAKNAVLVLVASGLSVDGLASVGENLRGVSLSLRADVGIPENGVNYDNSIRKHNDVREGGLVTGEDVALMGVSHDDKVV